MKNLHKSKRWEYYVYPLNKEFLSGNSLKGALNAYFRDIVSKLRDNDFIMTQFSIGYGDQVKSISPLDTNNNKDFDELLDSFTDFLNLKIEDNSISGVDLEDIETIIFKYRHLSNEDGKTTTSIHWPVFNETVDQVDVKKVKTYKHFGFKLPSTMDLRSWGEILHQTDNYFHIKKYKSDWYYYIDLKDECMEVELKDKKGVCILKFVDHPDLSNESPLWNFERKIFIKSPEGYILKYIHYFEDGVKTLQKVMKKVKFLKTKVNDTSFTLDIITMDLETRAIDGYMWPYCISIYDGNNHKTWYQADHVDMIEHAVSYLLNEKYDKFKIYTHNFSHFDSVFLLKSLHKLCKRISPTIRDGRFIETKLYWSKNNNTFRASIIDSMLLLPQSLAKLSKSFGLEDKGIFPYTFTDDMNKKKLDLNYVGKIPRFKFFDLKKDKQSNYIEYVAKFKDKPWNLKTETIEYCEKDCVLLYKIITKFNETIFDTFGVDAFKYPTISSLAFAIFRTNYLKNDQIPLIDGQIYKDIKPGYTGGAVDIYRPYSNFKKVYGYDVNSLYPYVMAKRLMPVGKPIQFEGNIWAKDSNAFGFFEAEILAPDDLFVPVLQTKLKTENGKRTVSPVGTWIGTYFSEELKYAQSLGYEIKVLRGYLFEKENVFEKCIEDLYVFKQNSIRGSAEYVIYKLLMNSLYGRFGMSPIMDTNIVLDEETANKYYNNDRLVITQDIELNDKESLLCFHNKSSIVNAKDLNISLPVAAATTALARIYMHKFKNKMKDVLYYSDTDSLYVTEELDPKFIDDLELGKFKLERVFEKGIFLAPKMYAGRSLNKDSRFEDYVKIKGVKINLDLNKLISLLSDDRHLDIAQEKWFREIHRSTIRIDPKVVHTLKLNSFKRKIIYKNSKFIETKPLKLHNSRIVD